MIAPECEKIQYRSMILREILRSFLLGLITTLAAICFVFAANYENQSQFLAFFGILVSVLLGCLIFLFSAFFQLKKINAP